MFILSAKNNKPTKKIAEVKNDLINNITHEFKTPIATIGVALESIKDFNIIDDKEKTKKYLNLSSSQLGKLNTMVEKLLETATLDSGNLDLNRDTIDLVALVSLLVEKHQMQTNSKTLTFNTSAAETRIYIDVFHFENAINNIVDNAIKYGGDDISISINKKNKTTEILISDNGKTLTKQEAAQIFDKFYRVPKGNTHDVKGFGIGLYYTKKIIEKHNGNISVSISNGTTFKITIPNER
ncbi:sensor histidine kinase [Lacinutrix jangbogonensis]|uniref:sensor histidine kinase n=1 Tax=Lacinutrix jangbogonensis TaxID=1469557 RepID=UPI000AA8A569|nr:HAMP domain-containing sensor histidine kinase [Lacinutrix jangbogonensis]